MYIATPVLLSTSYVHVIIAATSSGVPITGVGAAVEADIFPRFSKHF